MFSHRFWVLCQMPHPYRDHTDRDSSMARGKDCFHGSMTSCKAYAKIAECLAFLIKPYWIFFTRTETQDMAFSSLKHSQLWHPGSKEKTATWCKNRGQGGNNGRTRLGQKMAKDPGEAGKTEISWERGLTSEDWGRDHDICSQEGSLTTKGTSSSKCRT